MAFWAVVLGSAQYSVVIQRVAEICNDSVKILHKGEGCAIVKT